MVITPRAFRSRIGRSLAHPKRDSFRIPAGPALSLPGEYGYNSHMEGGPPMRSVNVATLKNQLSKYLTFSKAGDEVIIRDRNLPVAKLVPFSAEDADEQELRLAAEGKLRLPSARLNLREFLK